MEADPTSPIPTNKVYEEVAKPSKKPVVRYDLFFTKAKKRKYLVEFRKGRKYLEESIPNSRAIDRDVCSAQHDRVHQALKG